MGTKVVTTNSEGFAKIDGLALPGTAKISLLDFMEPGAADPLEQNELVEPPTWGRPKSTWGGAGGEADPLLTSSPLLDSPWGDPRARDRFWSISALARRSDWNTRNSDFFISAG